MYKVLSFVEWYDGEIFPTLKVGLDKLNRGNIISLNCYSPTLTVFLFLLTLAGKESQSFILKIWYAFIFIVIYNVSTSYAIC